MHWGTGVQRLVVAQGCQIELVLAEGGRQVDSYGIGIDLGGTKIEGVLLDADSGPVARLRLETRQQEGYEAILSRIANLVRELRDKVSGECTIGLGTPGSISPETGLLRNSNTHCLNGQPLKDDLERRLGQPLALDNDANCFALAEARAGAAQGCGTVFGVILGTGVGGGIVLRGKIQQGFLGIAGEWGHHLIHPGGRSCVLGHRGCVEAYLSGPALERRWLELTGRSLTLSEVAAQTEGHDGFPGAAQWKTELLENFGIALSNVINILDPEMVVLGGGVSNLPILYTEGVKSVQRFIFSDNPCTPIVQNRLGDSAGVFGAAWLGQQCFATGEPS